MKTIRGAFSKFSIFLIAITLFSVLLTALGLPCTASAANNLARVPAGGKLPCFIDDKNLLTPEQAKQLTAKLDEISARHKFDTVVAVVSSLDDREVRLYAADFYEQNGFGFGNDLDGIILLLATEDRDFGFATTGYGLMVFSDDGQKYLEKMFLPHLKENKYFEAFMAYADAADNFLTNAEEDFRIWSTVNSLIIALIIAFTVTFIWKRQLKSVIKQNFASDYVIEGSMALTRQQDFFLYRNVSRTARPKSGGSGGSGSFKSSSGRSFSGRSGKY
ncbi:MAG: TPM domain-containing protein [Synergistaceae bacterium]|nr:TPM domain-containing protein [Synergistaceae bacterium]